ncbi:MAG: DUF6518 family protein [Candidatus Dormibacteria bacterium]
MNPVSRHRLILILLTAAAFGSAMAVIKGNGGGVRDAIGNTSAPWLLLAFIAGAVAGERRVGRAALAGAMATFVALGGFYLANTFVLRLGPHPWLVDLRLTFQAGELYFALAVLSGPTFGALGGLWQRRRSAVLGVGVAALLVFEPAAWLAYEQSGRASYTNHPVVWAGEVIIGIAACVFAGTFARRRHPAA